MHHDTNISNIKTAYNIKTRRIIIYNNVKPPAQIQTLSLCESFSSASKIHVFSKRNFEWQQVFSETLWARTQWWRPEAICTSFSASSSENRVTRNATNSALSAAVCSSLPRFPLFPPRLVCTKLVICCNSTQCLGGTRNLAQTNQLHTRNHDWDLPLSLMTCRRTSLI